jgi:hypothetical protein
VNRTVTLVATAAVTLLAAHGYIVKAVAPSAPPGCAPSHGLRFICGPEASEDLARVPGTPWLITSGMNIGKPAQLYVIDTDTKSAAALFPLGKPAMTLDRTRAPGCDGPPDLSRMSTDGLGLRSGREGVHMLYAANHGDRAAIEMFEINATGNRPRLRWVGCALLPTGTLPNAVTPLPGDGLLVTSFYDPTDKKAWQRMARGEKTGRLLEWHPETGFRVLPGSELSGANGVETNAEGNLVYVSAWSARKLVVLSRDDGARREIPLDFMPDNIRRLDDGSLLVAGQRTSVEKIAACAAQCPQPWVVVKVDPQTGTVRKLLMREGTQAINYACSALLVGDTVYITARGDRRIAYVSLSKLPSLR